MIALIVVIAVAVVLVMAQLKHIYDESVTTGTPWLTDAWRVGLHKTDHYVGVHRGTE